MFNPFLDITVVERQLIKPGLDFLLLLFLFFLNLLISLMCNCAYHIYRKNAPLKIAEYGEF